MHFDGRLKRTPLVCPKLPCAGVAADAGPTVPSHAVSVERPRPASLIPQLCCVLMNGAATGQISPKSPRRRREGRQQARSGRAWSRDAATASSPKKTRKNRTRVLSPPAWRSHPRASCRRQRSRANPLTPNARQGPSPTSPLSLAPAAGSVARRRRGEGGGVSSAT